MFTPKEWQPVEVQTRTAQDMSWGSAGVINFRDLDGDKYDYMTITYISAAQVTGGIMFRVNNDAGNNYRGYYMGGRNSSLTNANGGDDANPYINGTLAGKADYPGFCIQEFLGTSGNERIINLRSMSSWTAGIDYFQIYQVASRWKNTADKLTSIQAFNLNDSGATSCVVRLYRRNKDWNQSDWELIEKKVLSGVDCSAGLVFSGLNGDKDEEYKLTANLKSNSTTQMYSLQYFNGDTTSGNYKWKFLSLGAGTAGSQVSDNPNEIFAPFNSVSPVDSESIIKAKSGSYRSIRTFTNDYYLASPGYLNILNGQTWWENSVDNIENIQITFTRSDLVTGNICLYRKKKKPTYASNWEEVARYDIDGDWSNGNLTEGLNGDIDLMYKIETVMYSKTAGQSGLLAFNALNSDVGASACLIEEMWGQDSSVLAWNGTWNYWSGGVDSVYPTYLETIIYPKSGKYRPMLLFESNKYNNATHMNYLGGTWWLNTADVITKILHGLATFGGGSLAKEVKGTVKISRWRD